ncbi:MAG: hypothetical protein B0A82_23725 [Alkalinema sp. CACIAM 70d]|nr:MAG: hypothetical protein B0A82_23725 [Alkalinema sp. CACIAM 70d]
MRFSAANGFILSQCEFGLDHPVVITQGGDSIMIRQLSISRMLCLLVTQYIILFDSPTAVAQVCPSNDYQTHVRESYYNEFSQSAQNRQCAGWPNPANISSFIMTACRADETRFDTAKKHIVWVLKDDLNARETFNRALTNLRACPTNASTERSDVIHSIMVAQKHNLKAQCEIYACLGRLQDVNGYIDEAIRQYSVPRP